MAKMPQSDRVMTPEGRASYCHVFKPRKNDRDELKFELVLLLPKGDPEVDRLKKIAQGVGVAQWPDFTNMVRAGKCKWPFRDGDLESSPDYKGHWFMAARNDTKPQVLNASLQDLLTPDEFGSGDYCRITGRFYAFEAKGNKGVSFSLGNVQMTRKGVRLDNKVDARTEFDALPGSEGGVPAAGGFDGDDDL